MTIWTLGEIKFAINMHDAGRSFSEIADAIHKTRCAVAGKFFRMGMCDPTKKLRKRRGTPKARRIGTGTKPFHPKVYNHVEDIQDFFSPETFGKGF